MLASTLGVLNTHTKQRVQRPFCWPELKGNNHPIYSLEEWLGETNLQPGKLCQVFWREKQHVEWRWKNFPTTKQAALYANNILSNKAGALLDIGITAEQPAYPGAATAEYI